MIIRRPKEGGLDNAEEFDFSHHSTAWSVQQRQRRQNKTFGGSAISRQHLQRSQSLRQEFGRDAAGFLPDPLDLTSSFHRRSSSLSTSEEEEGFRELNPPPRPPRTSLRMTRSATLPINMPGESTGRSSSSRRRLSRQHRSHSLALGPSSSLTSSLGSFRHHRSSTSVPLDLFDMIENQHQNTET